MKKYDGSDVSFLIPIRIDSIKRLENLILSTNYLLKHFRTNVVILEAAEYNTGVVYRNTNKSIKHYFVEDKDPIFFRTKYLNMMAAKVDSPYIVIWDADIIVPKDQIIDSIIKLREGYDVAYPYSGCFYDTSEIVRELYLKTRNIKVLVANINKMDLPYGDQMVGGAIFVKKESYQISGMENTKFYGWGLEDGERFHRWLALEFKIYISPGVLFHLSHPRGNNSTFRSENQRLVSLNELFNAQQSSKSEILNSIMVNMCGKINEFTNEICEIEQIS